MNDSASVSINKPGVVVSGPRPTQLGGLATFVRILLSSAYMQERYELIHLDTTRGPRGVGQANRLAVVNLYYFVRQAVEFIKLGFRYRPRLLHVPVTSFWSCWKDAAFILMARVMGMKVVAHLHGGAFQRYYLGSPLPIQWTIGCIMRRAHVVIALSDRWKRFLLEEVSPNLNVQVVANTVDAMFAQAMDEVDEHSIENQNLVLFVGLLSQGKGVLEILKAVPLVQKRLPDVKFLLAGTSASRQVKAEIDQACVEAKANEAVRFLGKVTGRAKLVLYLSASVFILPSHVEAMPYAILEAMCAGLPIVSTPVGAIPEMVEEGVNGFLIQPGDYYSLADRIIRLLEDAPLRASMSRNNRERIRAHYTPQVAMTQLDMIYRELLGLDWTQQSHES